MSLNILVGKLVKALETLCNGSSSSVIVFSASEPPQIPYHRLLANERPDVHIDQYINAAYLIDPFYLAMQEEQLEGVYTLKDIAPQGFSESEFFQTYYVNVNLADEICLLIRAANNTDVILSVGRHPGDGCFSPNDRHMLHTLYSMTKELINQWVACRQTLDDISLEKRLDKGLEKFGSSILTPKECVVTNYVLKGHSLQSIADRLGNSVETVRHHRKNIYRKLDVSSQAELFYLFIESLKYGGANYGEDPLSSYLSR